MVKLHEFYAVLLYMRVLEHVPSMNNFYHKVALVERVALKYIQKYGPRKSRNGPPS